MDRETKIAEILKAWDYKSGNDSCNSVYLGSMEQTSVLVKLCGSFDYDTPFKKLLDNAPDNRIDSVHKDLEYIIKYMKANPVKKCECCGHKVKEKP